MTVARLTISRVAYWRLATLLPVLLPLVSVPVMIVMSWLRLPVSERVSDAIMFASMGVFVFGAEYLLVVAALLVMLRRRTWRLHAAAATTAPLLMTVAVAVVTSSMDGGTVSQAVRQWGPSCLELGYSYVGLAWAGMWFVSRAGGFPDAA